MFDKTVTLFALFAIAIATTMACVDVDTVGFWKIGAVHNSFAFGSWQRSFSFWWEFDPKLFSGIHFTEFGQKSELPH
jgi:hypothetical protein